MFNMFGNMFGRLFSPAFGKTEEEPIFESIDADSCKSDLGYNPYCDGVRCFDKDDYFPDGYTEEELRSIYYDLNQEDGMDLLIETADFDEVDDYYNPGEEEVDPAFVLEAVTVKKFSRLEGVIRRGMLPPIRKHMKVKDPTTGEPITVLDPIIGKPKKSAGFAYVTAQIPFSDGQVVSIIFHAPEGDGKKIGPADMVVAFRWLLNKRDITAVVAPEDGKEVSLETISLRLAQLVGKNAKRFASTQKEVQAKKKQLEELTEQEKELDEQNKSYEDKIASGLQKKEDHASEIGALQAELASQQTTNRELETILAGLRKQEEAAKKNEPETGGKAGADKDAGGKPEPQGTQPEPQPADKKEPSYVKPLNDILDGKYDNDIDEISRLINAAIDEGLADRTYEQPEYKTLFIGAISCMKSLLRAYVKTIEDTLNLPENEEEKSNIDDRFAKLEREGTPIVQMQCLDDIREFAARAVATANKPAAPQPTAEPDWVQSMHDIIDGKYDNDAKEISRLLHIVADEMEKPDWDPKWEGLAKQAAAYRTELIKTKAKAAGF